MNKEGTTEKRMRKKERLTQEEGTIHTRGMNNLRDGKARPTNEKARPLNKKGTTYERERNDQQELEGTHR